MNVPGVSLTAACFSKLEFEDDSSGDCLSNLLAVGFRGLEIDLYWDEGRQVWSFCPVSIPSDAEAGLTKTSSPLYSPVDTFGVVSDSSPTLQARSTSSITPSSSVVPDSNKVSPVSIGPYVCTTTVNLSLFTSQLLQYIQKTQTNLAAHLIYVTINVHAVSSYEAPLASASAPALASLPQSPNLLGELFSANLTEFLYTPTNLGEDRANLKNSWLTVAKQYQPAADYYITETNPGGLIEIPTDHH